MDADAEVATWRCEVLDVRCWADSRRFMHAESWVLEGEGATLEAIFKLNFF